MFFTLLPKGKAFGEKSVVLLKILLIASLWGDLVGGPNLAAKSDEFFFSRIKSILGRECLVIRETALVLSIKLADKCHFGNRFNLAKSYKICLKPSER